MSELLVIKLVKNRKGGAAITPSHYKYLWHLRDSIFANCMGSILHTPIEGETKKATALSTSFLDIYLKFDSNNHLSTTLYDIRVEFNFAF
jgi:hypothetical protein